MAMPAAGRPRLQIVLLCAALALSIPAAFMADPAGSGPDPAEAGIDWSGVENVEARGLAGWIMDRKPGLIIVDVRSAADYEAYHIPRAVNVSAADSATIRLDEGVTRVICGPDSRSAIILYKALERRGGTGLIVLRGGMKAWIDEVLFPDLTVLRGADAGNKEKISRMSLYFGGTPKTGELRRSSAGGRYIREGC